MSFFEEAEREIRAFRAGEATVADYRLCVAETSRAGLGVESNRVGSPYAPLTVSDLTGGSFLVRWSDGTISRGALSRAPREALREVIASAYEGRYEDPDDAVFPAQAEVPEVELFSPEVGEIAEGRSPHALPEVIDALLEVGRRHDVKVLDGSVAAGRTRRMVASSGGFRGETRATHMGFSVAFDSLAGDGHGARVPLGVDEVVTRAERTAEDFEALRTPAKESVGGPTTVVLHPGVAEAFFQTFLFSNLSGGAVANGNSRFSPEDFRESRRWFREDLSIVSRPLEALGVGSYRFTDEGVVARDVTFVEEGRLVTPSLGWKYARRLDMRPAPLPGAFEGFDFSLGTVLSREEALRAAPRVVVVHSTMGLHTQDAVRAEYSVLAPQGVLYEDGVCRGRVGCTLNGSFFADLASPDLAFVRFEGFKSPGLLLQVELS